MTPQKMRQHNGPMSREEKLRFIIQMGFGASLEEAKRSGIYSDEEEMLDRFLWIANDEYRRVAMQRAERERKEGERHGNLL